MAPVQILGAVIAAAGVLWIFLHPGAKGEGEASYGGITLKSVTQGGLILVVGAVLIVVGGGEGDDDLTPSEWATKANEICSEGFDEIRALEIPSEPQAQFEALPQVAQIAGHINQQIQAIGRPSGAEAEVDRLLALASQENVEGRRAFDAWKGGDQPTAEAALSQARHLTAEVQLLDGQLGANVCALGP